MKGHKNTYSTIEGIVDSVCLDLGEGAHRKEQYLGWAIKEANRWKFDMANEVKTVELTLTPWKSVELPQDCINWVKLGVQDGNVIKVFVHRKDIAIYHQLNENGIPINNEDPVSVLDLTIDPNNIVYPFFNYNPTGENPGKLFGYGVKDNGFGYFTENRNEDSNEIQFRTKVSSNSKIYLEYIADSWSPNAQTLIHPFACELIELGIHYRRLKFDKARGNRNIGADDVRTAKNDYNEEFGRVIDRKWEYTVEDILEKVAETNLLTANPW